MTYCLTYRFDLAPVKFAIAHFQKSWVLQVQDCRNLLIPVAHDKGSSQLVEFCLFEATICGWKKSHKSQHCVHIVFASHLRFKTCKNFLDITSTDNCVLHPEALLIVDVLLPLLDLHGDVHMRVNKLLRLCYIHLFDVSHIISHLFNRHLGFFLVNQVLNLL